MKKIKTVYFVVIAYGFLAAARITYAQAGRSASGTNLLQFPETDLSYLDLACNCFDPRLELKFALQAVSVYLLIPAIFAAAILALIKRKDPVNCRRLQKTGIILAILLVSFLTLSFVLAYSSIKSDPDMQSCCSHGGWWF